MGMRREEFITKFAIAWLAQWSASRHGGYCMTDRHEELEDLPLEDAFYLAEKAWEKIKSPETDRWSIQTYFDF